MKAPSSILEAFVLANTPPWLFSKLKSDPNVVRWADEEEPSALRRRFEEAVKSRDAALAYGLLVALMLRGHHKGLQGLDDLQWGRDFVRLFPTLLGASRQVSLCVPVEARTMGSGPAFSTTQTLTPTPTPSTEAPR